MLKITTIKHLSTINYMKNRDKIISLYKQQRYREYLKQRRKKKAIENIKMCHRLYSNIY